MLMPRLFVVFVFVSSLLAAPTLFAEEPPEAVDTESGEAIEDDAEKPTRESERELLKTASSITDTVSELRGLALKESIPKGVQDREELRDMLLERFHDEVPEEDFQAEARVYARMGLFDDDVDYRELMLDLLTEQIAGFYDQDAKELYIMEGLPERVQKPAMAHEIFHAIQDQHFDIGQLLAPLSSQENADFALARMALIEGDATVVMIDFVLAEQGILPQNRIRSAVDIPELAAILLEMDATQLAAVEQLEIPDAMELGDDSVPSLTDSVLGTAPPIIRDTLLFPYVEGMRFVIRARSGRTWEAFDQIYDDPPISTSQILHPERYFDEDAPVDISYSAQDALSDHELIYETVFGELQVRSWLDTHLAEVSGAPRSAEVAEGWDGDRIRGYAGPNDALIVTHMSSWRSIDEAQAFAEALSLSVGERHGAESIHREGTHGESWCIRPGSDPSGERIYIERWGDMVMYIEGAPSRLDDEGEELDATVFDVRDAMWETHRRVPFEEVLEKRKADQ